MSAERPENADSDLIRRMLDDTLWNLGIGAAVGVVAGAVLLPRGASGARAVLAGLGGGFGAGRVYERYNVALQELQTGGSGIIPSGNVSFDDFKNKVGGVVNQVRNAVGLGTAAADSAKEEDDSKPADSDEERS